MSESEKSPEKKKEYLPSGFFAFRTALLPFQELLNWAGELQSLSVLEDAEKLKTAFEKDRQLLRERFRAILDRPEIREAVFVASPSLDEGLERWKKEPDSEKGKRAEEALVRYFSRMSGRSTPFGLFAGTSVGRIDKQTRVQVQELKKYRRHTRLDMDYLFALAQDLYQHPELRQSLVYRPNSSLYKSAGRYRYAEARLQEKIRSYHLVAVNVTDYLAATLARAEKGARLSDLSKALVDGEITQEEADSYIQELVNSQILVPELAPAVTGPEPVHGFIQQLNSAPQGKGIAQLLDRARAEIEAIDAQPLGVAQEPYKNIAKLLASLPTKVELSRLFQVDMVKPSDSASLGENVVEEILKGVAILQLTTDYGRQDALARFAQSFTERYESREVPLLEVLDEEVGIGFDRSNAPSAEASPLLDGVVFPSFFDGNTRWGRKEAFLLNKLLDAREKGLKEITIEEKELGALVAQNPRNLPDAFAVMGILAGSSGEEISKGNFRVYLSSCGGPSGANLLGRFCHGDPELTKAVEDHVRAEEALEPDGIFAELVHLPEGRVGNVLLRPLLRKHEIPYLGASGAVREDQIPVQDLMLSVVGGQIVLRSKKLGKRIFPRLTSAHGYFTQRNLGVYRFLGALQHQGVGGGMSWDWGALDSAPFLPRVCSGKMVLSRARWKLTRDEIEGLQKSRGADQFRRVQKWKAERGFPRVVKLADYDNELPVDLDNPFSVESFLSELKGRGEATLVEMFPGPEELIASGPEGKFVSEIVVPFVRNREATAKRAGAPEIKIPRLQRSFTPGSEWLYAKLYTGTSTADQLLRSVVRPVVDAALKSGAADSWFFIRYGDPEWHLRLRFHGAPEKLDREVLSQLRKLVGPLVEEEQIWKMQLDTYEREVERYGGEKGIVLAEQLFRADSEAVLSVIESLSGDELADARWKLALFGTDMLLNDFGLDLEAKHERAKAMRESFGREFRADDTYLKHMLGQKFRKERKGIESLVDPEKRDSHPLAPLFPVYSQRSHAFAPIVAALKEAESKKQLTDSIKDLLPSYVHMHINRTLRSAHRAQELVIYDFLERLYDSQKARRSGKPKPEGS